LVERVMTTVALVEHYRKEDRRAAEAREENLAELISAAREYALQDPEPDQRLVRFLSETVLGTGETGPGNGAGAVQLMTLHAAKGLEFPVVFMVGMEEGLFPNARNTENPVHLEEERRLCYVGMTRAERHLIMTYAEQRRLHGAYNSSMPSRFLDEIPSHLMREVRLRGTVTRPVASPRGQTAVSTTPVPEGPISLGQRVRHPRFGEGVVLRLEGSGPAGRVQVKFADHGTKWLVLGYANLQVT
jgi:DNA helicase-2/ATP-dependent DNA helicase PcrA